MTSTTPTNQMHAIARQDSHGTPFARSKREVRAEASQIADAVGLRPGSVTVSTWLGAAGDSYCLHMDAAEDGNRIVVHRWHSTGEIIVRRIFGSFWRPRTNRDGVEYAKATTTADEGIAALIAAVREVAATQEP